MTELTTTESKLLVLPDGRILAQNVTPELSAVLKKLQPDHPNLIDPLDNFSFEKSSRHTTQNP